jgi:hypothetical protein
MKKLLLFCLTLLLLTGCSSDYELKVNKYSIEENINFTLKDNDYDKAILLNELFRISNIDYDDNQEMGKLVIDKIRNEKLNTGYNVDEDYINRINMNGSYIKKVNNNKINLTYTYKDDSYNYSNTFNSCFGDTYYDSTDDYYVINGYNSFKCLIKDKMKVSIKSNYRVIDSNADKIRGNEYIWYFTKDNNIDHDLYIQVSKKIKSNNKNSNYFGLIAMTIILLSLIIYKLFIKKDKIGFNSNNDV